jgi:hypothetical protein
MIRDRLIAVDAARDAGDPLALETAVGLLVREVVRTDPEGVDPHVAAAVLHVPELVVPTHVSDAWARRAEEGGSRAVTVRALVVRASGEGAVIDLLVRVYPGSGCFALGRVDATARRSAEIAASLALGPRAGRRGVSWQVAGADAIELVGGSAGLALAVGIRAAAFDDVPQPPQDTAFTGVVEVDGRVSAVASVGQKVRAASLVGVRRVVVPDGPALDAPGVAVHRVQTVHEAWSLAGVRVAPRTRPAPTRVTAGVVLAGVVVTSSQLWWSLVEGVPTALLRRVVPVAVGGPRVGVLWLDAAPVGQKNDRAALARALDGCVAAGARAVVADVALDDAAPGRDAWVAWLEQARSVPVVVGVRSPAQSVPDGVIAGSVFVGFARDGADEVARLVVDPMDGGNGLPTLAWAVVGGGPTEVPLRVAAAPSRRPVVEGRASAEVCPERVVVVAFDDARVTTTSDLHEVRTVGWGGEPVVTLPGAVLQALLITSVQDGQGPLTWSWAAQWWLAGGGDDRAPWVGRVADGAWLAAAAAVGALARGRPRWFTVVGLSGLVVLGGIMAAMFGVIGPVLTSVLVAAAVRWAPRAAVAALVVAGASAAEAGGPRNKEAAVTAEAPPAAPPSAAPADAPQAEVTLTIEALARDGATSVAYAIERLWKDVEGRTSAERVVTTATDRGGCVDHDARFALPAYAWAATTTDARPPFVWRGALASPSVTGPTGSVPLVPCADGTSCWIPASPLTPGAWTAMGLEADGRVVCVMFTIERVQPDARPPWPCDVVPGPQRDTCLLFEDVDEGRAWSFEARRRSFTEGSPQRAIADRVACSLDPAACP